MKIHLIGIGGTGMGALAGLLVEAGHEVRGSDGPLYPPMSTLLAGLGVPLFEGYGADNLGWGPEVVVVGNICRKDHVEAVAAAARGIRCVSFPQLLGELFLAERHVIVVAGTHGKTTTTTLCTWALGQCDQQPGFLVGGISRDLGRSYGVGRPPFFVVEGDEYDCAYFDKRPKFVHYRPTTVILTGVEFDHADIYPTMDHVERAFSMLVERVPAEGRILVCGSSETAVRLCDAARCEVQTYSVRGEAHWQGEVEPAGRGRQAMVVRRGGERLGRVELPMSGLHNMENALAVIGATVGAAGQQPQRVFEALGRFGGVKRRQEVRGRAGGVTVIDDFAHHPTAVRETLDGLRGVHGQGKLWAIFEPRSATSRRNLLQPQLTEALTHADQVVLAPLHAPEGIAEQDRLDPAAVVAELNQRGTKTELLEGADTIAAHVAQNAKPNDTVVVMSSGAFGGVHEKILNLLTKSERGRSLEV